MAKREIEADVALELSRSVVGGQHGGFTIVADEYEGQGRWDSWHRMILRDGEERYWALTYSRGLTEYQETDPPDPTLEEVEARVVKRTEYFRIED